MRKSIFCILLALALAALAFGGCFPPVIDDDPDINDEAIWGIIKDRETARQIWEMDRFGQNQVLRFLEQEKQAKETTFTPTPKNDQD